jgi:hypothetical protein
MAAAAGSFMLMDTNVGAAKKESKDLHKIS